MLTRVTLLCFAASYAVALLLEGVRVFSQTKLRLIWLWGWTLAGMVAHTSYLIMRANDGIKSRGAPLSNWYHWCLIAAWCMALVYLLWSLSRPGTSIGLFLLPLTLGLIALARTFPSDQSFPVDQATRVWGTIHGIGLLIGTVSVLLGFATGIMYLLQARRLKLKKLNHRVKLPSLEWLGRANERCLIWSAFFLTGGLLAGIVLNMTTQQNTTSMIPWTDPGIFVSAILQIWLVAATIFAIVYKPARVGRKVAYLTVANFVILALTLSMVLFGPSDHTRTKVEAARSALPTPTAPSQQQTPPITSWLPLPRIVRADIEPLSSCLPREHFGGEGWGQGACWSETSSTAAQCSDLVLNHERQPLSTSLITPHPQPLSPHRSRSRIKTINVFSRERSRERGAIVLTATPTNRSRS